MSGAKYYYAVIAAIRGAIEVKTCVIGPYLNNYNDAFWQKVDELLSVGEWTVIEVKRLHASDFGMTVGEMHKAWENRKKVKID